MWSIEPLKLKIREYKLPNGIIIYKFNYTFNHHHHCHCHLYVKPIV